ncbi:TonB-dependent receptor [Maricurvus nonylphenolicus]|uniref:TonB-dependent receptor n=1 Tax=Maricurvus nonylphenolicus TaxID=1008307 RepID=UPI0036F1E67F
MKLKHRVLALPLAISTLIGQSVLAEDFQLEEIVVTAQKRSQSLQDVPIAVKAMDTDQLRQSSITNLSDLSRVSPGLSISNTQNSAFTAISVRGVSTATVGVGAEASTAIYIDGVYQRDPASISNLLDIAQAEVLKGPQGTLFGRNAAAGAVNIQTASPSEEFEGYLSATYGNENLKSVSGVVNIPLSENLQSRTSFISKQRDGWQKDTDSANADDLYEIDNYAVRNRLLWMPTDELSAELILDYAKEKGTRSGFVIEEAAAVVPGFPTAGFNQTHKISGDEASVSGVIMENGVPVPFNADINSESVGAAVLIDWELNEDLTLTSITSYRDTDRLTPVSGGGLFSFAPGALPYLSGYVGTMDNGYETFNQELRLSGLTNGIDWFVGVNYFKDTSTQSMALALPLFMGPPAFTTGELGDARLEAEAEIESYAIFGDVIFPLSDTLNLTVGARYSSDEKEIKWDDVAQKAPNTFYPQVTNGIITTTGDAAKAKDDWSNVSGRIVLDYQLNDDTMVYGSVSQGYKAGGFNTELTITSDPNEAFDPEISTSYELGLKTMAFDGRVQANAAMFFNKYSDYQFQAAPPGEIAAKNLVADAEVQGMELGVLWRALESLTVSLDLSYLDAEFVETVSVTGVGGTANAVNDGQDMLRAPEWSAQLGVDYSVMLADLGEVRVNASYFYSDTYRLNNASVELVEAGGSAIDFSERDFQSGSYGLLNMRVSYLTPEEDWEVSLWGTNLTDESYRDYDWIIASNAVYGVAGASTRAYQRNEPRMYGVDVRFNF